MEKTTFILAVIGSILGVVGSFLGVINFILSLSKSRVRLKVFPKITVFLENKNQKTELIQRVCVEVLNLSEFPISISEAGFIMRRPRNVKVTFLDKKLAHGGTLPKRMDPRTSITIYHPNPNFFKTDAHKISGAFVITECGKEIKGKNKMLLKQLKGVTAQTK